MSETTQLLAILLELAARLNTNFDAALVRAQLQEAAENNGLALGGQVPDWLLIFFSALLTGDTVARQRIPADKPFTGDLANFLAELEDIVQLTWEDSGEEIMVAAQPLRTSGVIFREGDTYEVGALGG